ncbi:MAG: phage protein [Aeromonas sobria]
MTRRISGQSFDTTLMGTMVHIEKASLSITDNSAVALTRGVPDGFVDGDVAAELEFEFDTKNFNLLCEGAKRQGSWRGMEPDDVLFYADSGAEKMRVEAFGVKLMVSDLIDVDPKGGNKTVHKVKGFVTSPDFVHINGMPYLSADDTRHLKG